MRHDFVSVYCALSDCTDRNASCAQCVSQFEVSRPVKNAACSVCSLVVVDLFCSLLLRRWHAGMQLPLCIKLIMFSSRAIVALSDVTSAEPLAALF